MKGSEQFTEVIRQFLHDRCVIDPVFCEKCQNKNKSLEDCVDYILGEVQASGCNGFADDEIFGMAMHYFDEENIEIKNSNCNRVAVNYHIELTESEKLEARQKAIDNLIKEEMDKRRPKTKTEPAKTTNVKQTSLF